MTGSVEVFVEQSGDVIVDVSPVGSKGDIGIGIKSIVFDEVTGRWTVTLTNDVEYETGSVTEALETYESNAAASASAAATQAGVATTQAGIATTRAGEAAGSASTATTQAGIATGAAGTATTQASIATTKAGEAATSESRATTKAGEASTSAELSQAWAEGTEPGGTGTKSAQEHAADAEASADRVDDAVAATEADAVATAADRVQTGLDVTAAESARDAAFANADVYADIATGRAAVADDEQFMVVDGDEIVRYRRDDASTETEMARYPSADAVNDIQSQTNTLSARRFVIAGDQGNRLSARQAACEVGPETVDAGTVAVSADKDRPSLKFTTTDAVVARGYWYFGVDAFPSGNISVGITTVSGQRGEPGGSRICVRQLTVGETLISETNVTLPSDALTAPVRSEGSVALAANCARVVVFVQYHRHLSDPSREVYASDFVIADGEFAGPQSVSEVADDPALSYQDVRINDQLIDPDHSTPGYRLPADWSTDLVIDAARSVTDWIKVEPSTVYYKNHAALRHVWYDRNRAPISTNTTQGAVTSPERAAFIRITMDTNAIHAASLFEGATAKDHQVFLTPDQVLDTETIPGTNLFNKDDVLTDMRLEPGTGVPQYSAGNIVTNLIAFDAAKTLHTAGNINTRINFYDATGVFISTVPGYTNTTITPPANAAFLRVGLAANKADQYVLRYNSAYGETHTYYEPWGKRISDGLRYPRLDGVGRAFPGSPPPASIYRSLDAGDYTGLGTLTLTQINDAWDALVTAYPDYITKTVLGQDQSGLYDIACYRFRPEGPSVPIVRHPPKVAMLACIHGYEQLCPLDTLRFFQEICNNWQGDDLLTWLRWNIEFELIPMGNPWGYVNNDRRNSRGVDLNRNFTHGWGEDPASGTIGGQTYGGTAPLSEAESQIIDAWLADHTDAMFFIDHHNQWAQTDAQSVWTGMTYYQGNGLLQTAAKTAIQHITANFRANYGLTGTGWYGYYGDEFPKGTLNQHADLEHGIPGMFFETSQTINGLSGSENLFRQGVDNLGIALTSFLRAAYYHWQPR